MYERTLAMPSYVRSRQTAEISWWWRWTPWQWIKWFFLMLITAGIYSFWVVPALNRWVTEHTDFTDA